MANDLTLIDQNQTALLETTAEKYQSIESELNEIHQNLTSAADKLSVKLTNVIEFADQAQHPKMYEALAKLMQAYSGLNRDAAAIVKQKQELYDSFRNKDQPNHQINNDNRSVNFHGTANDLLDHIMKK